MINVLIVCSGNSPDASIPFDFSIHQAFIDEQKAEVQEALQQRGVDNTEALSGVLRESRSILERPSGIRSINIPEVGQGWGGEPLLEPERRLRQLSRPGSGRNPWSSGGCESTPV